MRYQYVRNTQDNEGIGQFSLPTQGFNSHSTEQTVQISDTQVLSPTMVNETRFQYIRNSSNQIPISDQPTLNVLGAFNGGGSPEGTVVSNQDHYELQNYTSIAHGRHFIKFGGRLRGTLYSSNENANFNGQFTFSSLNAYQITQIGLQEGLTPAQIRAMGGGASQFSIIAGQPLSDVSMIDVGLYAEDEWRIRPNISLSYGLRYETQTGIPYEGDWAPRVSLAWGLGHSKAAPKTVLRGGYRNLLRPLFLQLSVAGGAAEWRHATAVHRRPTRLLSADSSTQRIEQAGENVAHDVPGFSQSAHTVHHGSGVQRRAPGHQERDSVGHLSEFARRTSALPAQRQCASAGNVSIPTDPTSGIRPFGGTTNIYQYSSEGVFEQNQMIVNGRVSVGSKLSLFGFYSLNFANSDLGAGAGGGGGSFFGGGSSSAEFVMNSYDPMQDYGRAAFDVRNRAVIGGTISLPYAFRLSPFILANSAAPFNIIVGQDLNGDSIFNDRPALASTPGPGGVIIVTPLWHLQHRTDSGPAHHAHQLR